MGRQVTKPRFERDEGETWRDVAIRIAKDEGLQDEVGAAYDRYMALPNETEEDAAWCALYDWDLL